MTPSPPHDPPLYGDGQPFQPLTAQGLPRCKGRSRSRGGAQCGNATVPGAVVCGMHGGAAPQVVRKANLRLAELIMPAIATLAREMTNAEKSADRIKAANSLLDRAGIPRNSEITVETAEQFILEQALAIVAERPDPEETDDEPPG